MSEYIDLGFNITANDEDASKRLEHILGILTEIQGILGSTQNVGGASVTNINNTQQLTFALQRQLQILAQLNSVFVNVTNTQNDYSSSTTNVVNNITKIRQANDQTVKSLARTVLKFTLLIRLGKRVAKTLYSVVSESSAFVENLNLFAVTFGENYQKTLNWALDFADNLGYASNEIIRFTGLFKQLATSIGVVQDVGTDMAETLTKIGYDLASFYNIEVESAFEKLQAGIFSGQTKPLRSLGLDVTQQTLDDLLKTDEAFKNIGVTSSKSMLQADKAMLRTIVILKNSQNAWADVQKTIDTTANQIRVFQAGLSNLKLALGDAFEKPFHSALVAINGLIQGITKIIRAFVPIKKASETAGLAMKQYADETEEAIEATTGKNLDIDAFRALDKADDAQLNITQAITDELQRQIELYNQYTSKFNDISTEAGEIAEKIKSWFIITDEGGKFKEFTAQAKILFFAMGSLVTGGIVAKITSSFENFKKITTSLTKSLSLLKTAFTGTTLAITAGIAIFAYAYITNEDFKNSINNLVKALFNLIGKALTPIIALLNKLLPIVAHVLDFVIGCLVPILDIITAILEWKDGTVVLYTALTILGLYMAGKMIWNIANLVVNIKNISIQFKNFTTAILSSKTAMLGLGITAGVLIGGVLTQFPSGIRLIVGALALLIGAALAAAAAVGAFQSAWSLGIAATGIVAGIIAIGSAIKDINKEGVDWKKWGDFSALGFAGGGITDANFIMTHENGKSEWVGKQGNKKAIVNDTQMNTIMSDAVERGVVKGLSYMGGEDDYIRQPIVFNLDGEVAYQTVVKIAKQKGKKFANV